MNQSNNEMPSPMTEEEKKKLAEATMQANASMNKVQEAMPAAQPVDQSQPAPAQDVNTVEVKEIPAVPSPQDQEVQAINNSEKPAPVETDVKVGIAPEVPQAPETPAETEHIETSESEETQTTPEMAPEDSTETTTQASPLQGGVHIDERDNQEGDSNNSPDQQADTTENVEAMPEQSNVPNTEPAEAPAPQPEVDEQAKLNEAVSRVEENTTMPPITEGEELSKDMPQPQSTPESQLNQIPEQTNPEQEKAALALKNAMNAPVEQTQGNIHMNSEISSAPAMPQENTMNMNQQAEVPMQMASAQEKNTTSPEAMPQPIASSMEQQSAPTIMESNSNQMEQKATPKYNSSELPSLEAPAQNSGGGSAGSGGRVGKPEGTGVMPQKADAKPEVPKQSSSADSGISSILGVVGIAVVLAAIVLFLFFTFVITPDEGSIFYVVREAVNSLL
ncbi:hypothetical protein KC678_01995 [Candidatus Dojkabacteria bacterium]|uniref:Uncharacterized protein n=1 Tax=Candidatus Dojkabacteria bacterium TaxID=2099670 RepID=A0A955I9Y7_9BACT|nr:hypothetical protein [Candidatus Dojkabacteria bacterium]